MFRHPFRAPLLYLATYFALYFSYSYGTELMAVMDCSSPPPGVYCIDDTSPVSSGIINALLVSLIVGLVPALSSLAGVALASRNATPSWRRSILFVLPSFLPLAAVVPIFQFLGHLAGNRPDSVAFAKVLWLLMLVLVTFWLLAPAFLTKHLYLKSPP